MKKLLLVCLLICSCAAAWGEDDMTTELGGIDYTDKNYAIYVSKEEVTDTFCDACEKCMTYRNGDDEFNLFGISIEINNSTTDPNVTEFYQEQVGRYKLNKKYAICYECWFKSLGIPEKE